MRKYLNIDFELGCLDEVESRWEGALARYRAAIRVAPSHSDARLALARLLTRLGRFDEALGAYAALSKRAPRDATVLRELCRLQGHLRDFEAVYKTLELLERVDADIASELAEFALGCMMVCNWSWQSETIERLRVRLANGRPCFVNPYSVFASSDDPNDHLRMAKCIAAAITKHTSQMPRPRVYHSVRSVRQRLHVGSLCGDLNNHPTGILMAGVLERHDRTRFEITAYDYSREDGTSTRARCVAACERFVRLGADGPAETAARIAKDQIDILVDMKDYTSETRSEIMALRPARIQVSFLGYVGTQGGNWIDYVIADRHVLPMAMQRYWHEKIVHMPHSYYPNDRSRAIPRDATPHGRREHGLPESRFVFVCFNSPYKITSNVFAMWMAILREVHDSVLWLYEGNRYVAANLKTSARSAGVDPVRLIFGRPMEFEAHINRHAYADLFLDTMPYGAHTTAADALWAGVPVVSLRGQSFASRVGASMLHAVGLSELICDTPDAYISLAVELARNRTRLELLRRNLIEARTTSSLFDAARFAIDLEGLFLEMAAPI